eukprot:768715-Hanusia_phi.AAC.5
MKVEVVEEEEEEEDDGNDSGNQALSTAYDGMGRIQEARAAYYKSLDLGKKDEGEMFLKDFDKMEKLHQRVGGGGGGGSHRG